MKDHEFYKLMLITHRQNRSLAEYLFFIEDCIGAGVSAVQLREKDASQDFLLNYANQLKSLLDRYAIPLIINDNVDLALAVDAKAVHLGQTDGSPSVARKRLGPHKWIGLSIETEADLLKANESDLDYVAASAVFPSSSKTNLKKFWGIEGLKFLAKNSRHPVIAIGGIDLSNVKAVMAAGAQGIALIAALHEADKPKRVAAQLRELVESSGVKNE